MKAGGASEAVGSGLGGEACRPVFLRLERGVSGYELEAVRAARRKRHPGRPKLKTPAQERARKRKNAALYRQRLKERRAVA